MLPDMSDDEVIEIVPQKKRTKRSRARSSDAYPAKRAHVEQKDRFEPSVAEHIIDEHFEKFYNERYKEHMATQSDVDAFQTKDLTEATALLPRTSEDDQQRKRSRPDTDDQEIDETGAVIESGTQGIRSSLKRRRFESHDPRTKEQVRFLLEYHHGERDVLSALLNSVSCSPPDQSPKTMEKILPQILTVDREWIQKNLVEPEGSWPACSRKLPHEHPNTRNMPVIVMNSMARYDSSFCALTLIPSLRHLPLKKLRVFYPDSQQAEEYQKRGEFPKNPRGLCVLCAMNDMHMMFCRTRENRTQVGVRHSNVSIPWAVQVNVTGQFVNEDIIINPPGKHYGVPLPFPRFVASKFMLDTLEDGKAPDKLRLRMDYALPNVNRRRVENF